MKFITNILGFALAAHAAATPLLRTRIIDDPVEARALQDIVTWDERSLYIRGERIMIFSGEFHPFRLPVPSLWLDVFQKIKALGMNTVSFYTDWALLEGKQGSFSAEGSLALEPFFDAAKKAGIYLIARPGPYINAEASGGGFPGWLQRSNATLRTKDPAYLSATNTYMSHIAGTIAAAQITNGGPVILYQPENEYTNGANGYHVPDGEYMQHVIDQARKAGIIVPMISNDQAPRGSNVPGSGVGAVDIYGHDAYFFGPTDCATPDTWPAGKLPTDFQQLHMQQSPGTPYSLMEFQGGCWLPWGGTVYENCASLMGTAYESIYYKNDLSFGVAILNIYMTVGGTNWGNIGFPQGYTSYDYGAAIREDRSVDREKYSELKLIANFLKTTPSYLEAIPYNLTQGVYTDTSDLTITPLLGNGTSSTSFYIIRHTDETNTALTNYRLTLPTSTGNVTIPQLSGTLTLRGRDSKIHVVDYKIPGAAIVYSSAEIFTWKKLGKKTVLIIYGNTDEQHELQLDTGSKAVMETSHAASKLKSITNSTSVIINWLVTRERQIAIVGPIQVLMLDRADAHNYWTPEISLSSRHANFASWNQTQNSLIVKAGYLVRNAYVSGDELHIAADFNATTPVEVIGSPGTSKLFINGRQMHYETDANGFWTTTVDYAAPDLNLPNLESASWKYIDSLPELHRDYNDSAWPRAELKTTHNAYMKMATPTSLFGSDYGFNTGYLIFRGTFTASGAETSFSFHAQGGSAFGTSVWINGTHLDSWTGDPSKADYVSNVTLPQLVYGKQYILTIIVDQNGLEEEGAVGDDVFKTPRGLLDYSLGGRDASEISWKLTGNLGGEDYRDRVRGPLNEGGVYAERQGWHQPKPPSQKWTVKSPMDGIPAPGVGLFTTSFELDVPFGYDVPLYLAFANSTASVQPYRAQIYINGYQFGKYTSNIGPQTNFPVPEGILNYHGENWLALTLWAQHSDGGSLEGLTIVPGTPVQTAYGKINLVNMPEYSKRDMAY